MKIYGGWILTALIATMLGFLHTGLAGTGSSPAVPHYNEQFLSAQVFAHPLTIEIWRGSQNKAPSNSMSDTEIWSQPDSVITLPSHHGDEPLTVIQIITVAQGHETTLQKVALGCKSFSTSRYGVLLVL